MPKRTKIAALLTGELCDQEVCVRGWVRTKRDSKNVSFITLNDGSNQSGIQIIIDSEIANHAEVVQLNTGAAIEGVGKLVVSPGKGQKYEIQAQQINIYGNASGDSYPLQKKGHTLEYLREIAYLRPRTNTLGCVFRIRNGLAQAIHQFFQERDFIYVHTPIITASDAEGRGEMFRVTAFDLKNPANHQKGELDFSQDFFGKPVYLTVSGPPLDYRTTSAQDFQKSA